MKLKVVSSLLPALMLMSAFSITRSDRFMGCPDVDPLNPTVHVPGPNCTTFYRCGHGYPVLDYCPPTLHFNPVLEVCDWPDQADCEKRFMGCPVVDPLNHTVHLPGPNCTTFYRCDHGYPVLDYCPPTLHFNPVLQVCDWPDQAGCEKKSECLPLANTSVSFWSPASCNTEYGEVNDKCNIICADGFEHSGGLVVTCKSDGWYGQLGPNELPTCFLTADLGELIVDQINRTLKSTPANLLFLLDESGSVAPAEFDLEIRFAKALVIAFPLSYTTDPKRSAGVITFSNLADVDVNISTSDTCAFMVETDKINYSSGGTDILLALRLAIATIAASAVHNKTLVFLVTDGQSADPSSAADQLKANGDVLFTIGVAGYNPQQLSPLASLDDQGKPLFFGIDSFEIFEKLAIYLETTYWSGANEIECYGSSTVMPPPTTATPAPVPLTES